MQTHRLTKKHIVFNRLNLILTRIDMDSSQRDIDYTWSDVTSTRRGVIQKENLLSSYGINPNI